MIAVVLLASTHRAGQKCNQVKRPAGLRPLSTPPPPFPHQCPFPFHPLPPITSPRSPTDVCLPPTRGKHWGDQRSRWTAIGDMCLLITWLLSLVVLWQGNFPLETGAFQQLPPKLPQQLYLLLRHRMHIIRHTGQCGSHMIQCGFVRGANCWLP